MYDLQFDFSSWLMFCFAAGVVYEYLVGELR